MEGLCEEVGQGMEGNKEREIGVNKHMAIHDLSIVLQFSCTF